MVLAIAALALGAVTLGVWGTFRFLRRKLKEPHDNQTNVNDQLHLEPKSLAARLDKQVLIVARRDKQLIEQGQKIDTFKEDEEDLRVLLHAYDLVSDFLLGRLHDDDKTGQQVNLADVKLDDVGKKNQQILREKCKVDDLRGKVHDIVLKQSEVKVKRDKIKQDRKELRQKLKDEHNKTPEQFVNIAILFLDMVDYLEDEDEGVENIRQQVEKLYEYLEHDSLEDVPDDEQLKDIRDEVFARINNIQWYSRFAPQAALKISEELDRDAEANPLIAPWVRKLNKKLLQAILDNY